MLVVDPTLGDRGYRRRQRDTFVLDDVEGRFGSAEEARLRRGLVAVVEEPGVSDAAAEILILGGRAAAVVR